MNPYTLLKIFGLRSIPNFMKLIGLWGLMATKRRMIGIFFDPVLACNIRCKICYFSDPQKRKEMHGIISQSEIDKLKKLLMPHALKIQIGCAAEPTLYNNLEYIVRVSKDANIPHISLTTNGQLIGLGKVDLKRLIEAGLNEITLSLHGTQKNIYESLMEGSNFEIFENTINILSEIKKLHPNFIIRINFTINSLNLVCLENNNFFDLWDKYNVAPDIIQLRPIQKMGETVWNDFDLTSIKDRYSTTIQNVIDIAKDRNIQCIYPTIDSLNEVNDQQDGISALFEDISYCYVAPGSFYKSDFNPETESFYSYHSRKKTKSRIFKSIFRGTQSRKRSSSKKLNYTIK